MITCDIECNSESWYCRDEVDKGMKSKPYKLFINNLQVGNYPNVKKMMESAIMVYGCGKFPKDMKWNGKKLFINYYQKWEIK